MENNQSQVVNMQSVTNQPNKQSKKKMYCIIAGIIVVAVVAIIVVLWVDKKENSSTNNTNTNTSTNEVSNTNTNSNSNQNPVTKETVEDASYVTVDYKNAHDTNEFITKGERIKVPVINFSTADATRVNNEIETLYRKYENIIKTSLECEKTNTGEPCGEYSIGYKVYSNDDVISIVVLMQGSVTDLPVPEYLVYNFDKNTGNLLTLDDLLNIRNISKNDFIINVLENIQTLGKSDDYKESGIVENMLETELFLEDNVNLNKSQVTQESGVACFIDDSGSIRTITTVFWNAGSGSFVLLVPKGVS